MTKSRCTICGGLLISESHYCQDVILNYRRCIMCSRMYDSKEVKQYPERKIYYKSLTPWQKGYKNR